MPLPIKPVDTKDLLPLRGFQVQISYGSTTVSKTFLVPGVRLLLREQVSIVVGQCRKSPVRKSTALGHFCPNRRIVPRRMRENAQVGVVCAKPMLHRYLGLHDIRWNCMLARNLHMIV